MAPSITRWSHEIVSAIRRPTPSPSSVTTGTRRTEPTARIAPSGGLMMAENSATSNMPRFEIEKVAPDSSLARSFRTRARSARSRASTAICVSDLAWQSRSTGVMSPSSSATAIPMWARWNTRMASPWKEALTPGCCSSACAHAHTTKSLTEIFGRPSIALSLSRRSQARSIATSLVT